ncbi:MAG: hypothetical protein SO003_02190, partial [Candidatus Borkfalkiaceae bacterium]|nr:hypothetical protein [Christensenellaceae bacterium]
KTIIKNIKSGARLQNHTPLFIIKKRRHIERKRNIPPVPLRHIERKRNIPQPKYQSINAALPRWDPSLRSG